MYVTKRAKEAFSFTVVSEHDAKIYFIGKDAVYQDLGEGESRETLSGKRVCLIWLTRPDVSYLVSSMLVLCMENEVPELKE